MNESTSRALANPAPPAIGEKFDASGNPIPFLGNTIVCPVPPQSPFMQAALTLHEALRTSVAAPYITIMPPSSLHMTLFDGVLDTDRSRANWPAALPATASLTDCDRLFTEKMQRFDMQCRYPFRMKVAAQQTGLADPTAFVIFLEPVDDAENRKLRHLRERLADWLGLHHPGWATYRFHSTQVYIINWLPPAALQAGQALVFDALDGMRKSQLVLELPQASFCFFDDLMQFRPRVPLRAL